MSRPKGKFGSLWLVDATFQKLKNVLQYKMNNMPYVKDTKSRLSSIKSKESSQKKASLKGRVWKGEIGSVN